MTGGRRQYPAAKPDLPRRWQSRQVCRRALSCKRMQTVMRFHQSGRSLPVCSFPGLWLPGARVTGAHVPETLICMALREPELPGSSALLPRADSRSAGNAMVHAQNAVGGFTLHAALPGRPGGFAWNIWRRRCRRHHRGQRCPTCCNCSAITRKTSGLCTRPK